MRTQFFTEFRYWNRYRRSTERIFGFPNALWPSVKSAFHVVSDTLVNLELRRSEICCAQSVAVNIIR